MRLFRALLFFCFIIAFSTVSGQNLTVESFRLLENDLTANTQGTMMRDQNGDVAALIKIVTTWTDFNFSIGSLGIVATSQQKGEIWVYVPGGAQRITISHADLGVLRDYYFPIPIEKARTYEMKILSNIIVNIKCDNADAELFLNNKYIGRGSWEGEIKSAEYQVEARLKGCKTSVVNFTLISFQDKNEVIVPAPQPIMGSLGVNSNPSDATVVIDGNIIGNTPINYDGLLTGNHIVEIKKEGYKTYSTVFSVETEEPQIINATLQNNSGSLKIISKPNSALVKVDNEYVGNTPFSLSILKSGYHMVSVMSAGYKDYSESFVLKEKEQKKIKAKLKPITSPESHKNKGERYNNEPYSCWSLRVGDRFIKSESERIGILSASLGYNYTYFFKNNYTSLFDNFYMDVSLDVMLMWMNIEDSQRKEEDVGMKLGVNLGYCVNPESSIIVTPQLGFSYSCFEGFEIAGSPLILGCGFKFPFHELLDLSLITEYRFGPRETGWGVEIFGLESEEGFYVELGLNINTKFFK